MKIFELVYKISRKIRGGSNYLGCSMDVIFLEKQK